MAIHTCTEPGCGLVHDTVGTPPANAEVEIARIQAESQVRIAELQARADKATATTWAEAETEIAHAEADATEAALADAEADEHVVDAINAAAVGLVETDAEPEPEPAPEPVIVQQVEETHEDAPPVADHHDDDAPKKSRGLGMW